MSHPQPWHFILASQSPYRRAQLANFGLRFETFRPDVDEDELKRRGPQDAVELALFLAMEKGLSGRKSFPQSVIIAADQVAELDGERFDKPHTRARAHEQLDRLQGRTHRLITSLVVLAPTLAQNFTDITHLQLRRLSTQDIEAYLNLDQPFDCAGAYKIEKAGLSLIANIETKDPSAIQGMPLISLSTAFRHLHIPLSELWSTPP